ncbi:MAG: NADH-quinone oxidoreductase subunit C [Epsilonproteobacteria bacterium]|nr:NADH-quinone oxidoreductase subunit C [Campylobacterota bacterium]MBD3838901.1 NADH-quinone oxidoreductase subunit C [Campylobacterota bacterium]
MRKYTPKDSVQKKAYYTDRFWVAPKVPTSSVATDESFSATLESVSKVVEIKESYIQLSQMVLKIDAKDNIKTLQALKDDGYDMCSELSATDYLARDGEFEIFYQMLSVSKAKRVRVLCRIKPTEAIESTVPLFKSANFAEREMYDMFGIYVNNHPYLKRLIMPDDWSGHPLLKTYPLQGDETASWYEVDKIFGKEYRDVIGPENRDPAKIDRYDTKRFSRVGYEVGFGTDISQGESETKIEYSTTILVDYNKSQKQLKERK